MSIEYKGCWDLDELDLNDLRTYKKFLETRRNDVLEESREWERCYRNTDAAIRRKVAWFKEEITKAEIIRQECDDSQYDYLLGLH